MTDTTQRWYQAKGIEAIFNYFKFGGKGHPLVVAPTGSGKSHILAGFVKEAHRRYPDESILVITHVQEIIEQDYNILCKYMPEELVGVYSSGLHRREVKQYTVASIQTIYKLHRLFQHVKLIIVDEAHLIPAKGQGRYLSFLANMPQAKVVGLTATPYRLGSGMLTDEPHLFDKIVYTVDIQKLVNDGYLSKISCKATDYSIDVSNVPVVAGDYNKKQLSQEVDRDRITRQIVQELTRYKQARKSWLIFAIDIKHCEHITKCLTEAGITAATVHSKLDIDRGILLTMFKQQYFQALVSVETLTTGFDAPNIDLIVLMRPTQSPVLHVQMIGRGMRVFEGKKDCLVLDFAGNLAQLGPIDNVQITKPKKGDKKGNSEGFTRVCPTCKEILHISKKVCPVCQYEFPVKTALSLTPDNDAEVLSAALKPKVVHVVSAKYQRYQKVGSLPTLKVTYRGTGVYFYHKWLAFEHPQQMARRAAERWWLTVASEPIPATVDEVLQRVDEIKTPTNITVIKRGKYTDIVGYDIQ